MTTGNPADRLDSWKEIAAYLRRDVRTVQRWEKKEGLPVYRHLHDKLGSIYAYRNELTDWFNTRQQSGAHVAAGGRENGYADKIKLAVLPFGNFNGAKEDGYFSDGLTEEMITQITRLQAPELAVIARTTAEHYNTSSKSLEQMKKELGVGYALEGKVRRGGNRVRITAQLIQLKDQTQLWAETYERDLSDVLGVQADIAQAIAREINLALNLSASAPAAEPKCRVQPAAYEHYLKARYNLHQMTPLAISKSIKNFEEATAADWQFAAAYAGMASAYALLAIAPFDFLPPHEAMPAAEKAARRALEIDNKCAEAHTALALVYHHYHWNWKAAEHSYERAIELNPDHGDTHLWYSWLLLALGRRDDAFDEIEQTMGIVQETDPHRLVTVHTTRAAAYYFGREYQRAIDDCEKAEQLDPEYFMLHFIAGRAHMRLNNYPQAIAHLKASRTGTGEFPLMDAALGLAYAVSGKKGLTAKMAEQFKAAAKKRYIPPTYFGMLFAGLGDRDTALEWLEKAFVERADGLTWLGVEPMLDELREDPRFQDLIKRIGLV